MTSRHGPAGRLFARIFEDRSRDLRGRSGLWPRRVRGEAGAGTGARHPGPDRRIGAGALGRWGRIGPPFLLRGLGRTEDWAGLVKH